MDIARETFFGSRERREEEEGSAMHFLAAATPAWVWFLVATAFVVLFSVLASSKDRPRLQVLITFVTVPILILVISGVVRRNRGAKAGGDSDNSIEV